MRISAKAIQRLTEIITGNSEQSPYRSGPELIELFRDFGERDLYGQGFPPRAYYVQDTSEFEPTVILHHPHSTDSPRIWRTAWSGARDFLPESDPPRHVWASGIGYYYKDDEGRRETLPSVQRLTRCCEEHVIVEPSI